MPKAKKNSNKKSQTSAIKATTPKRQSFILPAIPSYLLLFLALWVFGAFVYGDVFYMSQQSSYFAFDKTLLFGVLNQNFGWLDVAGRFLLLSFHYPVVGSAVLALMLTLVARLLNYVVGLGLITRIISFLVPFVFLGYFVWLDYSVNYMRETSVLMSYPAAALVLLAVVAAIKLAITKKTKISFRQIFGFSKYKGIMYANVIIVVAFVAITAFSLVKRDNYIRTCRMQRMLEKSDWLSMIDEALSARRPARSVAAYYAIALVETGQLETKLFELPFDFPKTTVSAPDMSENDGVVIYSLDCDFYAGLVNSSYHSAMETFVKCGPQVFLLKRMARAAAMNGEHTLCKKYLDALSLCGIEDDFVERYSVYADDTETMQREPEFLHVLAKMPLHDTFEQNYRAPYFIGYNVALTEGRSSEALRASIMACLYAKDTDFIRRAQLLRDSVLSPYVEQALMLQGLQQPHVLDGYKFDKQFHMSRLDNFINVAKPWLKEQNEKEGFKQLRDTWLNYYPFYLYFENLPTEEKIANHEKEKGGVN